MNIGKNFVLIERLNLSDESVNLLTKTGTERTLVIAQILLTDSTETAEYSINDVVVVDDTFITYWFDDNRCCVERSGILCRYDSITRDCRAFYNNQHNNLVVKASVPTDDIMLRNVFIQTGLVVIGGIESDSSHIIPNFNVPVAITAGDNVKHLMTIAGDYFIVTKENLIITFDAPDTITAE